jgi:trans-aconitate 2-methyltransferase
MTTTSNAKVEWDPVQYGRFAAERARPFRDLLSRVELISPKVILDLGCGTGLLTAEVADRWPSSHVIGVDASPDMLAEAERLAVPGRLEFHLDDVRTFEPDAPVDLVITNATLQWVPGHIELLGRIASSLAPGGVLALQVPGNFEEPTHVLLRSLASSARWREALGERLAPWPASHDPVVYLEALQLTGLRATAWETTYLQVLSGEDAVLHWMKGTALRPVLSALDDQAAEAFLQEYGELLRDAYPSKSAGTALPYRRVFAVGLRDGEREAPADVTGLDHVQIAIPAGGEDEGRRFYCGVLGFAEVAKPPVLAARGGCWFRAFRTEVHLGVDRAFRAAKKAHVGLSVEGLDAMARRLSDAGYEVSFDEELAPRRRFYTEDPFGNRLELLEPTA